MEVESADADLKSYVEAEGLATQNCNGFQVKNSSTVHLMGTRNEIRFPPMQKFRKLAELTREDPHLVVFVFIAVLRISDIKSSISFSRGYKKSKVSLCGHLRLETAP